MPADPVVAGRPIEADWGNDVAAAITALEAADVAADGRLAALEATATRYRWLDAKSAELDGSALVTIGAAPDAVRAIALADAATQGAYWAFPVPLDWASGTLTFQPWWAPAVADGAAHAVRWSLDVKARSAGGSALSTAGTTVAATGTAAARGTAHVLQEDPAIDSTITPAGASQLVVANLRRLGSDGADSFVGTVNLVGVMLIYTGHRS
jgi:hypothetical protein